EGADVELVGLDPVIQRLEQRIEFRHAQRLHGNDVGPWVIYYNQDALEAAGVPLPKQGWTLAEFTDAAKKLTKDGKYGFGITTKNYSVLAAA
ncbi:extracellular solute-binding protein, partial [Rhizobium ruizarguesonis]